MDRWTRLSAWRAERVARFKSMAFLFASLDSPAFVPDSLRRSRRITRSALFTKNHRAFHCRLPHHLPFAYCSPLRLSLRFLFVRIIASLVLSDFFCTITQPATPSVCRSCSVCTNPESPTQAGWIGFIAFRVPSSSPMNLFSLLCFPSFPLLPFFLKYISDLFPFFLFVNESYGHFPTIRHVLQFLLFIKVKPDFNSELRP